MSTVAPAVADHGFREDFHAVAERLADFIAARRDARVAGEIDAAALQARLARHDFSRPERVDAVAADVLELLGAFAVRSDHPRYFGLFNPPALPAAIIGDFITATANPQLAVWSHAPAAAEIEKKLIDFFARRVWGENDTAGMFTSGGTEANHTALLVALARRYPQWATQGVRALAESPAIYVSSEAHLAWVKIARSAGLGSEAVRLVPAAGGLEMTGAALADCIAGDGGRDPVLVVATAGTTAHGAIDDMRGIAAVARRHDAHFHVDAAWAGGGILHAGVRARLAGIEQADSVTIDPHKWLAVPMGAGMFLARGWDELQQAFAVSTHYMPSASIENRDAYIHSLQWSRRLIGLKLFMALATLGIHGYVDIIERQITLATYLRHRLRQSGWHVLNDTELPLVCFAPPVPAKRQANAVRRIEQAIVQGGGAWISTVNLRGVPVLRACVTSFESREEDVDALVGQLQSAFAKQDENERTTS